MSDERLSCDDCHLPYGDPGWCDAVLADDVWAMIAPRGNGGGVLCINCMARRISGAGLKDVPLLLTSGPFVLWDTKPKPGTYGEPTIPMFLCGKRCEVVLTSKGRDEFVMASRAAFVDQYEREHGEFPSTELQVDAILEAEAIFDRRVGMRGKRAAK